MLSTHTVTQSTTSFSNLLFSRISTVAYIHNYWWLPSLSRCSVTNKPTKILLSYVVIYTFYFYIVHKSLLTALIEFSLILSQIWLSTQLTRTVLYIQDRSNEFSKAHVDPSISNTICYLLKDVMLHSFVLSRNKKNLHKGLQLSTTFNKETILGWKRLINGSLNTIGKVTAGVFEVHTRRPGIHPKPISKKYNNSQFP